MFAKLFNSESEWEGVWSTSIVLVTTSLTNPKSVHSFGIIRSKSAKNKRCAKVNLMTCILEVRAPNDFQCVDSCKIINFKCESLESELATEYGGVDTKRGAGW